MAERVVHCWMGELEWIEEQHGYGSDAYLEALDGASGTCLLLDGHEGPHEFTPDDEIRITFAPAPPTKES